MRNLFIVSSLIFLITGCAVTQTATSLPIKIKEPIVYTNPEYKYTGSFCTSRSYTIKDNHKAFGNLFVEYIDLSTNCKWNGYARGFFTYEFKSRLKLKSMTKVEEFDIQNYEITTFIVNEKEYVNFIYKYKTFENIFIIDYDGKLTAQLLEDLAGKSSQYENSKRFFADYDFSLARNNVFGGYFSKDSEILMK